MVTAADDEATHSNLANIVLTGFMGTGKSVVGRLLAELTGRTFIDIDSVIEERHGPIAEMFAVLGEAHFRMHEREVARELAAMRGLVIATGGGTMLDETSTALLAETGLVYTLTAAPAEIVRRVVADGIEHRPLLAGPDPEAAVATLLAERESLYARFTVVETDGRTPLDIAEQIAQEIASGFAH